jgi:methanethiol S-methyltransferase
MLVRTGILIYAAVAYLVAMINLAYLIGFLAGIGVPKGINDGPEGPVWLAILVNVSLVVLFGLHHSVTARHSFKTWWTHLVPPPVERATYLYMTAVMTAVLVILWRPVPITLWQIDHAVGAAAIQVIYLSVWGLMFAATFHFGHMAFFGLRQALDHFREAQTDGTGFTSRCLYALVRHPISLGWMVVPWLTPHMTVGQMTFALATAAYVLVATRFEEADLVGELGDQYREYRRRVPAFVPRITGSAGRNSEPHRAAPGATGADVR